MMETSSLSEHLLPIFQQIFGRKVEVTGCITRKQLHDYRVLQMQLRHPAVELVVKLGGPEAVLATSFDRTAAIHQLVAAHTSLLLPEILAVNMSYQTWPWRYLVRTYIPGQEWSVARDQMPAKELSFAYQQIGAAVAQLHTIQFPTFGELDGAGNVLGVSSFLEALAERARHCIQNPPWQERFLALLDQNRHLFKDVGQPALCHEDLHKYNLLFQPQPRHWQLATILDFDKAWAGLPEIDLARMEFWRGMTSPAFWESYQAVHPRDPAYSLRRPIYQLLWCLEYADPSPQHQADTRQLCAQLGLPFSEDFT